MKGQLARLAQGTLVYGLGGVANRIVGSLSLPVLTRYLTVGDYGIAGLLDLLVTAVSAVFALGFGSSMTLSFFSRRDREWQLANVGTALAILLGSAALLVALGGVGARPLGRLVLGGADRPDVVRLALVLAALTVLTVPLSLGLQLQERARRLIGLNFFSAIATVGLSIVFVVPLGRGVAGLFEGRVVAQALVLAAFALQYPIRGLVRFDRRIARELLRLGLPMVPAFASTFLQLQSSRYLLGVFRDLDAVGIFSVGTMIGAAIGLAIAAFSNAWTPFFMSFDDRRDEAGPLFARVMTYYALGFGLVLILVFASARSIVMLLTRPAFHDAYEVVGLTAAAHVFLGAAGLLTVPGSFARDLRWLSAVQWIGALLTIVVGLVLIPLFGLMGAALALALGPLLLAVLLHGWNRRRGERYLRIPYDWGRVGRFAVLAAALALPFTWPRSLPLAAECALAAGGALAGIALTWLALTPSERRAARGVLARGPGPGIAG